MTTYGRFLEVPEVARMKSLLLWFVIYVYVRPGVVAEIELYSDVTSDDYAMEDMSSILLSQQHQQSLLKQRQQQLAKAEAEFGRDELVAAAEAAEAMAAAEAEAQARGGGGDGQAQQNQRLPFERAWSGVPPQPLGRGQQQRMEEAMAPDSLEGFRLGASVAQEPAFSYREPAGQAADGEVAPFAFSPKDMRFYEDAPSQISDLAGGDVYRSRDYGFRGGEEGAGAGDVDAAPADNSEWPERSSGLVQQPAQPVVPLVPVPLSSAQQPDQRQRGGAKMDGSSGSGPTSGAKKTGVEPLAAAAGDSLGLGRQQQSQAMDREAPSRAVGPQQAAASAGAVPPAGPEVGKIGGPAASDVAARAQAGADAAANAYQSARGHKVIMENEDEEMESVQSPGVQSDFMSGQIKQKHMAVNNSDVYFIAIVAGCCAAAAVGIVGVGISWYRLQKNAKAAADVEYPAYGVTGPKQDISPTSGDRRLAQSAQMYHYQHQKQQIIAMESRIPAERNGSVSDAESEEENEEGDYTVYECPGLAPTGEMEVKNPLFQDDPTPATPATGPSAEATSTTTKKDLSAAPKSSTKDHVNGETQKQQKP